jgi:hypothetical protein
MQIITVQEIEATKVYKDASFLAKQFLIKRANREMINNAIVVHRNTGEIPGNIDGRNLLLVKELVRPHHIQNNPEPKI